MLVESKNGLVRERVREREGEIKRVVLTCKAMSFEIERGYVRENRPEMWQRSWSLLYTNQNSHGKELM